MTNKSLLDSLAAILSIGATCGLLGLAKMIFDNKRALFKNDVPSQKLCNYALVILISGIAIYWYLLVQYVPDRKSPSWETIIGFVGCVLLMGAGMLTYKCLRFYCWPLLKIIPKLKTKMKVVVCFTVVFIFGTICWLWIVVAKILPGKIIPLLENI